MRKAYSTDLSDNERTRLRSCLPHLSKPVRPRTHHLREIFDAIFYVLRSGCPWRLLPHDFPPWQTVYYHLRRWQREGVWDRVHHTLVMADRERVSRDASPSAAIL